MRRGSFAISAVIAAVMSAGSGCGGGAGGCVSGLPATCSILYAATYENVFTRTLSVRCTSIGCHPSTNPGNGLALDDHDRAYDLLLGKGPDGRVRVKPGDPACSLLIERLESSDPSFVMPRGAPLSAEERCSIRKWIEMGASK
jgi:cytochrome c